MKSKNLYFVSVFVFFVEFFYFGMREAADISSGTMRSEKWKDLVVAFTYAGQTNMLLRKQRFQRVNVILDTYTGPFIKGEFFYQILIFDEFKKSLFYQCFRILCGIFYSGMRGAAELSLGATKSEKWKA